MYNTAKQFMYKFGSSVLMLFGNLLYNFYILYYSSSFKSADFLYAITVITTISSLIYTIENNFQYHFGRLLFSLLDINRSNINDGSMNVSKVESSITFFYYCIIIVVALIFLPILFFFKSYSFVVFIFLISCLINVGSGYFSLQLIAKNEIKKLHLSIGIIKLSFFLTSLLFFNNSLTSPIYFFSALLFFSLINLLLQRRLATFKMIGFRKLSHIFQQRKNFLIISGSPIKQMIICLIGFIVLKIYIIIGNIYMSKDIINSASLIQGLFSVSLMFGGMYTVLNMNVFYSGSPQIKISIYKKSLLFSLVIYFLSLLFIYTFNSLIIQYFNYVSLPNSFFVIISLIYFFETILGISATIYLYMQKIIYFKSSLITAFLLLITYALIYFNHVNLNSLTFMILPLLFQLFYNYWYYPIRLYADLKYKL